jgi:hypothetical protein
MNQPVEQLLFLFWDNLNGDDMQARIDWLRENLTAGDDWGFCSEKRLCVLKNQSATVLYKLRWFEAGNQTEITQVDITD